MPLQKNHSESSLLFFFQFLQFSLFCFSSLRYQFTLCFPFPSSFSSPLKKRPLVACSPRSKKMAPSSSKMLPSSLCSFVFLPFLLLLQASPQRSLNPLLTCHLLVPPRKSPCTTLSKCPIKVKISNRKISPPDPGEHPLHSSLTAPAGLKRKALLLGQNEGSTVELAFFVNTLATSQTQENEIKV